jgi:hypothetical protein
MEIVMRSNRLSGLWSRAGVQDTKRAAIVVIALLALFGAVGAAKAAEGNPFEKLSGAWTGEGQVRTSDDSLKKVTCKADYKTANNNLTLNLGCTGDDYEIEAKLKLADKDGRVKGTWHEAIYDASGGVTGRAHDDVIRAVIRGDKFSGRMSIKLTDAGHSINILQLNEDSGVYRLATSLNFQR